MVRVLVVESQNLCTNPGIPHMLVNPDRMGTEAGGSLKFAGFQTSQEDTRTRFRESSCLRKIGRVMEDTQRPLLASLYTHRHTHTHTHAHTQISNN